MCEKRRIRRGGSTRTDAWLVGKTNLLDANELAARDAAGVQG